MDIPTDPLIKKLRAAFRLSISEEVATITDAFVNTYFSQQIVSMNVDVISRNFSPFCCFTVKNK